MPQDGNVVINVNLEIPGRTLETVVRTAKTLTGPNAIGRYRIDTADLVSHLISRLLLDGGFADYVAEPRNYEGMLPPGET